MATRKDHVGLVRLWCEHSGWDQIDAEAWTHRFLEPPLGEACISVAEDEGTGELLGQFIFFPCLLRIGERTVRGLRPFAPVLSEKARGSTLSLFTHPLQQPIIRLYQHATRTLSQQGYSLAYMVPNPLWQRLFRLFPTLQTGYYPLWSRPLPLGRPDDLPVGYRVVEISAEDERLDDLSKRHARHFGCSMVRDSKLLPWKLSHHEYHVLGIERQGELVGMIASQHKGDRQWLVCDLMVTDLQQALDAALAAVCNLAHEQATSASADASIKKVAILVVPQFERALKQLGFQKDKYRFPFVVHLFDDSIDKRTVAPANWYVSAND